MAFQHEYHGMPLPPRQPAFPYVNHEPERTRRHGVYGFNLNQYDNQYFMQPPHPTRGPPEPVLYDNIAGGMPPDHFQEHFAQLNTPHEESDAYSSYPLRMPDPSDYISNNSLSSYPFVPNPYHTPEYEQANFMAIPDPNDYQTPWVDIDPYDPELLPAVREELLQYLQSKHNITQADEYRNCFSGSELVDAICLICGARRDTALTLGRVLQENVVFQHVSSENRSLMDNNQEFYKLCIPASEESSNISPEVEAEPEPEPEPISDSAQADNEELDVAPEQEDPSAQQAVDNQPSDVPLYTRASVLRQPTELVRQSTNEYENMWIASVSKEIVETLSDKERNRQIAIFEIIYTEEEYLRDLKLYDSLFIEPLRASHIFNAEKTERFIEDVFINYQDLQHVHEEMLAALKERQTEKPIVEMIGDVAVQFIEKFEPYIRFSTGSIITGRALKNEREHSSALESFLDECQKKPEARKLPMESFLSRPTSRIARYPLLLDRVLKYTPQSSVDRQMLVSAIDSIKAFLTKLNDETGRAENRLRLQEIEDKIDFKSDYFVDLKLNDPDRQLIREGVLKSDSGQSVRLILFDHVLLLTKEKKSFTTGNIAYRVYARPIPLEFLTLQAHSDYPAALNEEAAKPACQFDIINLSRWGGRYTLTASSPAELKQWFSKIQEQQTKCMCKRLRIFDLVTVSDHQFTSRTSPGYCSAECTSSSLTRDGRRRIIIGATDGLYSGFEGDSNNFRRILSLDQVKQVEIIEEIGMVIILQDKLLLAYSIDMLDDPDFWPNRHGQKLASHVSYFSVGHCDGKLLVVIMKSKGLKSYFKALEAVSLRETPRIKGKLLFQRNGFGLRLFKEFYIGAESSSVQFLTKKLYVVCPKGFEIVNLEALHLNKSIPDLSDETQFGFLNRREHCKPIAMFPLNSQEFILCYSEFAFHLDNLGRRTRPNLLIEWEGQPKQVALYGHYILAFDQSFIEIRNAETGELVQIITGQNIHYLNPGTHKDCIHLAMEPTRSEQYMFRLVSTSPTASQGDPFQSIDPLVRRISEF